jgi:hypothetical protein
MGTFKRMLNLDLPKGKSAGAFALKPSLFSGRFLVREG